VPSSFAGKVRDAARRYVSSERSAFGRFSDSEEIGKKFRDNDGRLARLLNTCKEDSQLTEAIFLATLNRRPNEKEVAAVEKSLAAGDKREEVYRDLFWAVLNSKEFAFNH